jgi:2-oxo-hept-3-ene-1,7-dioate hydratase
MLNEKDRDRAASLLLQAERSGVPTTQLDQVFPDIEIADAYAIQKRIIDDKLAAGAKLRGH